MPPKKISKKLDVQPLVTIPQLDLFQREKLQISIKSVFEEEILPSASWDSKSDITFNIFGDPETFIDPSSLRLIADVRIVQKNGERFPNDVANLSPISNFGCSLFERVAVRLGNSTQISGLDSVYPYLTYLENIFKNSLTRKKLINFPYVLYEDAELFLDRLDKARNKGFESRQSASTGSRFMHINVPIFSPITMQTKLLIPGVDMYIRMTPNNNPFTIMSTVIKIRKKTRTIQVPARGAVEAHEEVEEYNEEIPGEPKIEISNIRLLVRKYKLNPMLHDSIIDGLRYGPAIYPCKYQQLIEFNRVTGTSVIRETLFTDRILPRTAYLFILSTKRRLGDYSLSPWYIDHHTNLNEIKLVSGGETYPPIPYKPKRLEMDMNEMYLTMLRTSGSLRNEIEHSNGINMGKYLHGFGLIAFDLSRTYTPNQDRIIDMPRVSDLQVHIDYRTPLEESTSYIFVLEFDSNIYVRSNSDVTTDYV